MRDRNHRSYRTLIEDDLDTMPLMNLFVALIPMLLISAVFLNVTVIDMDSAPTDASAAPATESLALEVVIDADAYTVVGRGIDATVIARTGVDAEAQLATALATIAADHADQAAITVVSQPDTRYDEVITVMDVAREAGLADVSLRGMR